MNGNEVKKIREYFGENQTQFGKRIGKSKNTISEWEKTTGKISGKNARILKELLKEERVNVNFSGNTAGGNQNFFNDNKFNPDKIENNAIHESSADYEILFTNESKDDYIKKILKTLKEKKSENDKLKDEISELKDKIIDLLSK